MLAEDELIRTCIEYNQSQKVVSLPLQFSYLAVDILSKQFTKLNNNHEHRIHYLGPRYTNTQTLHKKCAYSEIYPICRGAPDRKINKYKLDIKRITNSFFINERLRTNHFYKTGLYYRAFEGMNPSLNTCQQFVFNGGFESANLDCVIKYRNLQFDLFLRIDSNTRGHLQWFYFSIQNGNKMQKIKLNICNISKPGTFYEQLMQPYVFSKKNYDLKGQTWSQGDSRISNVSFSQKPFNYKILNEKITTAPYCYSFQYQFQNQDDEVFFAYCIPYTYSQLLSDIQKLPAQVVKIYKLGESLTGLQIPLLHITNHSYTNNEKRNILISGRIHPGQSNGSHVLKGFINYLCSSERSSSQILKSANFYIIPMINPDGVVLGNSRCSASGRDLNRMFNNVDKQLFPQIHLLKNFTKKFITFRPILIYFDFHGHSKKKNTFFYGPVYPLSSFNYLKCRVLPRIIQKINCSFRYYSCSFSISQSKKSTGRATMFETFQIPYTYTVQSSICSYYDSSQLKTFTFTKESYQKIGSSICQGTSTFIIALDEYDKFLKQRKLQRQKKKNRSFFGKKNQNKNSFEQDDVIDNTRHNTLKILYKYKDKQKQECLFVRLLEQINTLPQIPQKSLEEGDMDQSVSSDQHDQKQDFQLTKLKQFNNLIIQNAKKDILSNKIADCQNNQMKQFVRSGNFTYNQFGENNKRNWNDQQLQLFQELNVRTTKSKSSQGNRNSKLFQQKRFFTKNLRKRLTKRQQELIKNQVNESNTGQVPLQKQQKNDHNKKYQIQLYFDDKMDQIFEKKDWKYKNYTTSGKSSKLRLQKQRTPHFSQMQFPDEQKLEQKKMLKYQKTDLLRKNIQRRRQDKSKLQNLNCSQLTIIKHPKIELSQNQFKSKKKLTEFKMDDLLVNLQCRSKMLNDSVKYKDSPNKFKLKSSFMFPSSFYGVRQQLSSKKRSSSYSRQVSEEQPFSLTVKNYNK